MTELRTLEEYRRAVADGMWVAAPHPESGHAIHQAPCSELLEVSFLQHLALRRGRHSRYYATPVLTEVLRMFGDLFCGACRRRVARDSGASRTRAYTT